MNAGHYLRAMLIFLRSAFIGFIVFATTVCYAQGDSISCMEETKSGVFDFLEGPTYLKGESNREFSSKKEWPWRCIGPDEKPEELEPGGRAIPAYAANRGNGTGRINYLYMYPHDQNKLWACSPTGGLWYTKNGGQTWLSGGTDRLPISGTSGVAVNPKNPRQWIVATGDCDDQFMYTDGLWRTCNNGKSYECINGSDAATSLPFLTEDSRSFIGEVVCKSNDFNYLVVASDKGLWVCEDAREFKKRPRLFSFLKKRIHSSYRWKRVAEGQFYDVEMISVNHENYIVASGEKLVISYDGGESWLTMPSPVYGNPEKYRFLRMSVNYSPALPYFLFVMVTCSESATASGLGEASFQMFDLKAREWKALRSMSEGVTNMIPTRARAFAVSPVNPNLILCANVQPIYRSEDGGNTFSKVEKNQMHDDLHHIVFAPDGKTVWASNDGGVSVSYDMGVHWQSMDKGISAANVFGVSVAQSEETQVVYGGYDTGGNLLRNGEWLHVSWGDGFETVTSPVNPDVIFTTMQNGNIQGSRTGRNFEEGKNANAKTAWHTWIRMHPTEHNTIYCSGEKLMRSQNLGMTWESIFECEKIDSTLTNAYRFFLSDDHPDVMYVYVLDKLTSVNPQIWRTYNLQEKNPIDIVWEKVPNIPVVGWIMNIAVDPSDKRKFWLLYNAINHDGKIWYFNDSEYMDVTFDLKGAKCESMILQHGSENRLYLGSNYGVLTKIPEENKWTLLKGLPGTYIKSLDINYVTNQLVVGTFGRGVWQAPLVRP